MFIGNISNKNDLHLSVCAIAWLVGCGVCIYTVSISFLLIPPLSLVYITFLLRRKNSSRFTHHSELSVVVM